MERCPWAHSTASGPLGFLLRGAHRARCGQPRDVTFVPFVVLARVEQALVAVQVAEADQRDLLEVASGVLPGAHTT